MATDVIMAAQYRIHPSLWGGMDEFISVMHRQLSQSGISMTLVVPRLYGSDASHYLNRTIPYVFLDGPYFFDNLIEYCSGHPAKILHMHFMPTLSAKYRHFGDSVSAIISTEHMSRPIDGWGLGKKFRTRLSAVVGSRYVDEMIHVSRYLEGENLEFFGGTVRRKSSIIHNGVKIEPFTKNYPDCFSPNRKLKLVSAGRLVKEKGFSDLIKVVRSIVDEYGRIVELDILGDGPMRSELERDAGMLMDDSIFFRGYVSDVHDRFRAADLYVHASSQEAFAFVLLEAGESGLPTVAYDVGGNSEIITNGLNGSLIPVNDLERMFQGILGYYANPQEIKKHGLCARSKIESEFSVSRMVADYISCYKKYL